MAFGIGKRLKRGVRSLRRTAGITAASSLLSQGVAAAKGTAKALTPDINIPEMEAPKVMPIPDEEAQKRAKLRSRARKRGRGGRSASILSGEDLLG